MTMLQKLNNLVKSSQGVLDIDLAPYRKKVDLILNLAASYKDRSDQELKDRILQLKSEVSVHSHLNTNLLEVYAIVFETCKRQLSLKPYDVQIIAGIAMHEGKLAEMKTGEGKTLAAVFPVVLNALLGKGVHVLTFNDYLAKRDAEWMAKVYTSLGLNVGFIQQNMSKEEKRKAYSADITYGTAKEIGFDFLRSFTAYDKNDLVLRPFHFAIVDEADALLIDEARNPLVLAGDILKTDVDVQSIATLAKGLKKEIDFEINKYSRNIFLTEKGIEQLESQLGIDNLMGSEHHAFLSVVNLAIHANELLKKDIDYVVRDGKIKLVDEFTGRIVEDRKWRNGLQTAVEAKEGLEIQHEGIILNSISIQHFILQYSKRAGMTATAHQSIEHFLEHYGLKVILIPPNKPNLRLDHPDEIFTSKKAKTEALLKEINQIHQTGRPILIGTLTVKESEELAKTLQENQLSCNVLNAKNNALEAKIIADAGKLSAITISTNMAGRGTDILLGGKDGKEKKDVLALGGLYVIGTNRHESERIDQQLRGRAGRQGDPGSSRFFVSLEDDLMIRFKLWDVLPKKYKALTGDQKIEEKGIRKFITHIQKVIEDQSSEIKRTLGIYSNLTEQQRNFIQSDRQKLLEEENYVLYKTSTESNALFQEKSIRSKLRAIVLFQYDKYWAMHLDEIQKVKEGIYMVRFGGQQPIQEFQKISDSLFQELQIKLDETILEQVNQLIKKPDLSLEELGIQKPSSTWTYVINDNPFGNKLASMLLANSNIGLQVDFISGAMLFFVALFEKFKKKKQKD